MRALARDLGRALGVGGHLTALRRTRIGPFRVEDAVSVDEVAPGLLLAPAEAATRVLPRLDVGAEDARDLRHGKRIAAPASWSAERAAAVDPAGQLVGMWSRAGPSSRAS